MRRTTVMAGLICLLVVGLMAPVTAQEAAPAASTAASAGQRMDLGPALADVDWSRFLPSGRSFAAADTGAEGDIAATRAALRAEHRGETSGDVDRDDDGLGFAARAGQRDGRYYDTCNDAGGSRLDLRATILVQRNDQQGFLGYTCQPWATPDLDGAAFIWALYTPEYAPEPPTPDPRFPDFLISTFLHRGALETVVVRTPEQDARTWYETWYAPGQRVDEHAFDVVVPTKAFGQAPDSERGFNFEWLLIRDNRTIDRFPELYGGVSEKPDYVDLVGEAGAFPFECPASEYIGQAAITQNGTVAPNTDGADWTLAGVGTDRSHASSNRIVAIVDDGVSGHRPGLSGRVFAGYDGFRAAELHRMPALAGGIDSDRGGHGSAVASVMAGSRAAGAGLTGLDTGANILPISVVDANGCINAESLARGITYAADVLSGSRSHPDVARIHKPFLDGSQPLPRHVMVIPLAGREGTQDADVRRAIDHAQARGVLVIAAAGNGGPASNVAYPAAYPGVVAVGATTADDRVAGYSPAGRALDVLAPGGDRTGQPERDIVAFWELGQLRSQHGTGLSAGLVGAAVSLYRSAHPTATVGDVRRALEASALDMGPEGHDPTHGYGRLQLGALLGVTPEPDADRNILDRIDAGEPAQAASDVSVRRFPDARTASHVVLARHDVFADALAGAPLTATGPLLLSGRTVMPERTSAELDRVLRVGGTVYLLGGTGAIDDGVAGELQRRGYVVRRLAGPSRIETAIAVADEVRRIYGPGDGTIALARAFGTAGDETAGWADAITGGAYAASSRTPLIISTSDRLHPAADEALRRWAPSQTILLGGTGALSHAVEATVPNPRRVAGADRAATAVAIADLWRGERTGFTVINGYTPTGWAFGLGAAGLAADLGRPLLLSQQFSVPEASVTAIRSRCLAGQQILLVGDDTLIGGSVEQRLAGDAICR